MTLDDNTIWVRREGVNVLIDYYRASFDLDVIDSDDEEIEANIKVSEIASKLNVSEEEIHQRYISKQGYRYCYELGPHIVLYMCKPIPSTHTLTCSLEMRGKGCRDFEARNKDKTWKDFLEYMIFTLESNASRIDIAIDDFSGKSITLDYIKDKFDKMYFTSVFKKKLPIIHGNRIEGYTYQLGSRESPQELCIYDKLKEQTVSKNKEIDQDYWVRYEMRFHRDKAVKVSLDILAALDGSLSEVTTLSGNQALVMLAKSLLRGMIDIKMDNNYDENHQSMVETDPKWIEFLDGQIEWKIKSSVGVERTWDTKKRSVKRIIAPYLYIRLLQSKLNIDNFTTMILKDFLDIFNRLENKNQIRSLNIYANELGLGKIALENLNDIRDKIINEVNDREVPF